MKEVVEEEEGLNKQGENVQLGRGGAFCGQLLYRGSETSERRIDVRH